MITIKFIWRPLAVALWFISLTVSATNLTSELESYEQRLRQETPMPVGEVLDTLESRLLSDDYTQTEKARIGALYVVYMLKIHHSASDNVLAVLESVSQDNESGPVIRVGLARMYGINAEYSKSYYLFEGLLKQASLAPDVRALAIAYLIVTYSENQVFASNARLINTLSELIFSNQLEQLLPLHNYMVADYYHSINSLDIALEYYEKSLNGALSQHDWLLVSDNLYDIGILHRNRGNYDAAISYFKKAEANDKNIDINYSEYLALYGMATTYFNSGQYDLALPLSEAVTSHPLTSAFYDTEIYKWRAKAFLDMKQYEEAEEALDISRKMYDEDRTAEQTTWRAELEQIAAHITAARGDYKTAFAQYEQFHEDYLDAKKYEDLELIESANLVHQIEQEREKASELEKENESISALLTAIESARATQQRYNQWLVVVIVLGIVTLLIILYLLRKSRHTNQLYADAKAKAELQDKLKTDFLSNISHEIRTPLNAIIGFGQVLTEKLDNPKHKRLTNQIVNSSEMLLQLINDLLDFSKIEAGKLELDAEQYNIRHSLKKLADIFHGQAQNKGLKLVFSIDPELPPVLIFDELRFKQILANLISNAIKFSSEGKIEIRLKLLRIDEESCTFEAGVKDNGIGISETQKETLFEPFIQAESSTARKYGGSGLGLHICNQLLSLMDSKLELESETGKGSDFFFTVTMPYATQIKPVKPVTKTSDNTFSGQRLLLVEDNDINVEVILAMLSTTSLQITRAANGREAVQQMVDNTFDIVLMDIQMPEMDGYEATRHIRQEMGISTPVIALTANAMSQDIEACRAAGMNDHISKPVQKDTLLDTIMKYLSDD